MTAEQLDTKQHFAGERKNDKARTRFVFVDVLNIISCFAVVGLHTSLGTDAGRVHFCGTNFLHGQRHEFVGLSKEIFDEGVF